MLKSSFAFLALALAPVIVLFLESEASAGGSCRGTFDFEDSSHVSCFQTVQGEAPATSRDKAKHSAHSLKWETTSRRSRLRYRRRIEGDELKKGGIKFWVYRASPKNNRKLKVRLTGEPDLSRKRTGIGSFNVNLGFKGWRAVWIAYSDCKTSNIANLKAPGLAITRVEFIFKGPDTIFIDLLEFADKISKQSRDKIVPPIPGNPRYDSSNTFQRVYHWSTQRATSLPTAVVDSQTLSLKHIEKRLKNWYFNELKTSYDFSTGFEQGRWDTLLESIDNAAECFDDLDLAGTPPSLFCKNCKYGSRMEIDITDNTAKFDVVTMKVLLPLALEYHFRSRKDEISETSRRELTGLQSADPTVRDNSLTKIAGSSVSRKGEFENNLQARGTPYNQAKVESSINFINSERWERIMNVLDYLEDQGWADGSALGSIDHEMNRDLAGFMHALFLLKDAFNSSPRWKRKLLNLIKTAKWYCEFGEVYQQTFEFTGTTADRMITIMLYRLMVVLVMPTDTPEKQRERQRDMNALKRWMDNALTINKAFGGVIKPDYTSFHHKAFYAGAYSPQALHTAAQVQYLLDGTDFALSSESKTSLRRALEVLRLTAVKYSTPVSVGGRFPEYDNEVLIKILPAFAYISVSHQRPLQSSPPPGIAFLGVHGAEMFLRLYSGDQVVLDYLADGEVHMGKAYMNSVSSLEILKEVHDQASGSAETSPEGHWSKNFAALSVHRRKDWAVSVKGFNNFVWDFEGKKDENEYGMFASHGAMLIANNEDALKAHDVNQGWDWTKIPGATTIFLQPSLMKLVSTRNFSPGSMAGGVTFQGTETLPNGVFGMDLSSPTYVMSEPRGSHRKADPPPKLSFKKSFFFFQNLIVCLGSNIGLTAAVTGQEAQTTVFQDKLESGVASSSIKLNSVTMTYLDTLPATTPDIPDGQMHVTLVDTKGNNYYIPQSSVSNLKVHVQDQTLLPNTARYATAWFEHSSSSRSYEYAAYVNTPSYERNTAQLWQEQDHNGLYTVMKQDDKAHVVKFLKSFVGSSNTLSSPVFGYVVFDPTAPLPSGGPIKAVSKRCLLMAQETTDSLHLSVSYPDLDFDVPSSFRYTFKSVEVFEMYQAESQSNSVTVTLNNINVLPNPDPPIVHGQHSDYSPEILIPPPVPTSSDGEVVFDNLVNGFSIEVTLPKYDSSVHS